MNRTILIALCAVTALCCGGCDNITYSGKPVSFPSVQESQNTPKNSPQNDRARETERPTKDIAYTDSRHKTKHPRPLPAKQVPQTTGENPPDEPERPEVNHTRIITGLGNTARNWNRVFGMPYQQGTALKVYRNGTCKVTFTQGQATTITLNPQVGEIPALTALIPKDSRKRGTRKRDIGVTAMETQSWYSPALKKALPATKGNFTIIKTRIKNDYTNIVITCDNSIQK